MNRPRWPRSPRRGQRGVYLIVYSVALIPLIAFAGLALDLSLMFARVHELQAVADSAALAAARSLNGTRAGLDAAIANAANAAAANEFRFVKPKAVTWSPNALSFGTDPDGITWTAAGVVADAQLPGLLYARVDTAQLSAEHNSVRIWFMTLVGASPNQLVSARAVAGRRDSAIAPLAVCALQTVERGYRSNPPAANNAEELLEYGFRRGVAYNLLNLNPNSDTTAVSYLVNPLDFPPAAANARHLLDDTMGPFVCTGSMPAPPLANGAMLYVRKTFPTSLIPELNSRFGQYTGSRCTAFTAPPDFNVFDLRGWWASPKQPTWSGSADSLASGGMLHTVADVDGGSASATSKYGPLWSFARPLRFNHATQVVGAEFTTADLSKLYKVSSGSWTTGASKYSYGGARSPYGENLPGYSADPAPLIGEWNRRVLNVPLLDCPVGQEDISPKRMLGIGRFLMTTPATAATTPPAIHAEFGGLVSSPQLAASAVLYR